MFFYEIHNAFIESLRAKVRNGETTERALAKLVGMSQPHLHNVLKGVGNLSPAIMDRCLYQLRLSVFDLVDRSRLRQYVEFERQDSAEYSYLPVLSGRFGPTHAWPSEVENYVQFPVPARIIRQMRHPVVARTGFDVRMHPSFADGDYILLDQSLKARMEVDPAALYVIKRGRVGLLRRLRVAAGGVHLVSEDTIDRPGLWERLPGEGGHLLHFVRAKAVLIPAEREWV